MTVKIGLCAALELPPGELPLRLQVVPPPKDGAVRGRDGRAWSAGERQAILAQLAARPIQLDVNHAAVHRAPRGEDSPAAAWLSGWEFSADGALWATAVDWTPLGQRLHQDRAYKFLSPALLFDSNRATPGVQGTITGLHSVGLTNDPNFLDLPALNAAGPEKAKMLTPEQLTALGLAADATEEQITARLAAASNPLKAIEDMLTRLMAGAGKSEPESKVAPNATEVHQIAVCAVVDGAVAAGKVAPATRAALVAMGGTTAEQLKTLQAYVAALPVIVTKDPAKISLNNQGGNAQTLDADQRKLCAVLGVSEADFLASRSEL